MTQDHVPFNEALREKFEGSSTLMSTENTLMSTPIPPTLPSIIPNMPTLSPPVSSSWPVMYPWVPFWTGCPLPFSPMAYPPIFPQMSSNFMIPKTPSQAVQTSRLLQQNAAAPSATVSPSTASTPYQKEDRLAKYRCKRVKRKWNRPTDLQRSTIAKSKLRDSNGQFTMAMKVEKSLNAQVEELRRQQLESESESRLLRERLRHLEAELQLMKAQSHSQVSSPASSPYDVVIEEIEYDSARPRSVSECRHFDPVQLLETSQQRGLVEPGRLNLSSPPLGCSPPLSLAMNPMAEKIELSKIQLRKTQSPHLREVMQANRGTQQADWN
mmetsp:Transcript_5435/g.13678  ORF Transcript_5435/g.13678 Transcript_5435/m.13678 type:complete len:326 (-) Transcript_5435:29-1006(-)